MGRRFEIVEKATGRDFELKSARSLRDGDPAMNDALLMELARRSIMIGVQILMPILLITLGIGVVVSIFQAATQIQEQTLTFVPKIVAVILAITFLGPWMLALLVHFTQSLIAGVPTMLH